MFFFNLEKERNWCRLSSEVFVGLCGRGFCYVLGNLCIMWGKGNSVVKYKNL